MARRADEPRVSEEETRRLYDTVAATYARVLPDTAAEDPLDLALLDHALALVLAHEGATPLVLDAGCGAGRLVPHLLARTGGRVVGVDLSPGMVATARELHPEARFAVGSLSALPLADGEADAVVAWYSIIHTAPTALTVVLAELMRVLRPGGVLVLAFQAGSGDRRSAGAYGHDVELHAHLHPVTEVAQALEDLGLVVHTSVERGPRAAERHPQGFVVARRAVATAPVAAPAAGAAER